MYNFGKYILLNTFSYSQSCKFKFKSRSHIWAKILNKIRQTTTTFMNLITKPNRTAILDKTKTLVNKENMLMLNLVGSLWANALFKYLALSLCDFLVPHPRNSALSVWPWPGSNYRVCILFIYYQKYVYCVFSLLFVLLNVNIHTHKHLNKVQMKTAQYFSHTIHCMVAYIFAHHTCSMRVQWIWFVFVNKMCNNRYGLIIRKIFCVVGYCVVCFVAPSDFIINIHFIP